ncbi:acetamidase/formamidase family protein [Streptomyces sp. NPDC057636]|uniref:acetamidase/formamidase family protein n=1 Tax=Streptomyces sp. NPDC057636 TaxID=3346189 RepID=UPI0036B6380D
MTSVEGWSVTDIEGLPAAERYASLQPRAGLVRGKHYLDTTAGTALWGRLPCAADAPVLRIRPGETVTIDTLSHEGFLEDQEKDPIAYFGAHGVLRPDVLADAVEIARDVPHDPTTDGPHVVTGPIAVRGARPGDMLAITVVELTPRVDYGVISNRHGRGALPGELPAGPDNVSVFTQVEGTGSRAVGVLPLRTGGPNRVRFPLRPFLGIMGVATPGDVRLNSVPPHLQGGNLDISLLVEGATLYLPVAVDEALAYVGDPHFAQGNGEVSLTALEASLRATLHFDVVPATEARRLFGGAHGPVVETDTYLIPTGLDQDLDTAVSNCVRNALEVISARYGMDRHLAYAYLSAATDFDISQVVDLVKGTHARIRKSDFTSAAGTPAPHALRTASKRDHRVAVNTPLPRT